MSLSPSCRPSATVLGAKPAVLPPAAGTAGSAVSEIGNTVWE
jgi:hypothetical protein